MGNQQGAPRRQETFAAPTRVGVPPALQRPLAAPPHAPPVRVSDAEASQLAAFTGAELEVCRRVLADCRGDAHAASEALLLSGGREVMCFTIPDGATPGQAVRVSTPRGMVEVTIPEGFGGGDSLTFQLPTPAERPAVAVARPVSDQPPPSMPTSEAVPPSRAVEYPEAVAVPPTPAHTTIILEHGRTFPVARPYYGYPGYYDPYYYYDPYTPLLFSSLLLSPLLISPFLWC
ncbi:hypothetical protein AB1Y20_014609 [Prymnesium parvum]|uniref:Uncharacterized protein n=1 Tax=Prymnesium parvum TaxID=97485 RepID=A0AB34IDS5_PRYPA